MAQAKIRSRQHLHIKIYHVTHERILMFLMLPTADMCFDKRLSKSTDQKLLTPHIFFFNWGESSKVLCGALSPHVMAALAPCLSWVYSSAVDSRPLGQNTPRQLVCRVGLAWDSLYPNLAGVLFF